MDALPTANQIQIPLTPGRIIDGQLTGSYFVGPPVGLTVAPMTGVLAVPEPETYAMMVAGLGLLGFMLRRRRRLPRV